MSSWVSWKFLFTSPVQVYGFNKEFYLPPTVSTCTPVRVHCIEIWQTILFTSPLWVYRVDKQFCIPTPVWSWVYIFDKQFYIPHPVWSWVYRFDKQFYLPPPVWIHGFDEEDSGFLLDGIQGFHQEIGKTHPLWSHVIHSISPALGSLPKRQTQYSKTFLIWHLCNPFPCVIRHWISFPFDYLFVF